MLIIFPYPKLLLLNQRTVIEKIINQCNYLLFQPFLVSTVYPLITTLGNYCFDHPLKGVINRGRVIIRGLKFERVLGHFWGVIIVSIFRWRW